MGFIERLRQERERKEREKQERERQQEEHAQIVQNQICQRKEAEKRLHEQRRNEAEKFHEESGISVLLHKLEEASGGRCNSNRTLYKDPDLFRDAYRGDWEAMTDKDSVFDFFEWNFRSKERYHGGWETFTYYNDYFIIETTPSGTIYFHADPGGSSSTERGRWLNNKQGLETALEKAYRKPKTRIKKLESRISTPGRSEGFGGPS